MSVLVKQAGIISAADFLRLFVKMVIGIVLARILTQADYGTYRQLFMIYTLMFSIFMIGLPQSVYYFIPKSDPETQKKFLRQTLDIFTILGLACSIILLVFRFGAGQVFHNPHLPKVLLIYTFYPFFMFVSQLYYFTMIGLQQTRKAAVFMIFTVVCDFVLVLGTALLTRNLNLVVAGLVFSVLIQWIYARIKLNPYSGKGKPFNFDRELVKAQLAFSLPIGISSIIMVISSQLDKLIISSYFSPEQFAVFSIGAAELPFIWIISNSVNAVILPEMNNRNYDRKSISELYRGAVRKNALLIFPLMTFCFVFAPHIIQILYSDKYLAAVIFFRIYLLIMPLRIATYSILFQVFNKTRYIFSVNFATLIINVLLSLLLINLVGIKGPAISTVIVTYLTVILYLFLIRRKLDLRIRDLFPLIALGRTFLAAIVTAAVCYLFTFWKIAFYGQFIIGSVLFFAIYFLLGNMLRAILPYDNSMLKTVLSSFYKLFRKYVHV
jgi:O-antigen/teichoic acid export membrane protein